MPSSTSTVIIAGGISTAVSIQVGSVFMLCVHAVRQAFAPRTDL
jgi:hypothetical protein